MLNQNKNKFTNLLVMSLLSTFLSMVIAIMLAVYDRTIKPGTTTTALPLVFNYFAVAVTLLFTAILIVMIFKRKKLKWFDFLAIALIIILWVAVSIHYATLCTSMQFPGDTKTLHGFYGIFFKMEIIKTYGLDSPTIFTNVNVNFELIVSMLFAIYSGAIYFMEMMKKNKEKRINVK